VLVETNSGKKYMSSILTAFQGCQGIKYEKKFIPKGISNLVVQIEKYRVGLAGYFRSGDFSDSVHCMDTAQCWIRSILIFSYSAHIRQLWGRSRLILG